MKNSIYFKNRVDAANKLIDILPIESMKLENWVVVASSFGAYPIAKIIANTLDSKFKMMFSNKIFSPNNDECEIAIITESEEVVIHEELVKSFDISLDYVFSKSKEAYEDLINDYVNKFRDGQKIQDLKNSNILLVDEGLNTGLTMMACIKTAITLGAKSVSVATPIIPNASVPTIESIADDLYFVKKIAHFTAIDSYYEFLEELTFEDIKKIKERG